MKKRGEKKPNRKIAREIISLILGFLAFISLLWILMSLTSYGFMEIQYIYVPIISSLVGIIILIPTLIKKSEKKSSLLIFCLILNIIFFSLSLIFLFLNIF